MENEYIHIIFDDHELHALLSLGTRYALDITVRRARPAIIDSGNQTVAGSRINAWRCQIQRPTVTVSYKYIHTHTHIIVKISCSYCASSGFRFSFLFQPSVSAFRFSLPFQLSVSAFHFSFPFQPSVSSVSISPSFLHSLANYVYYRV